MAATLDRIAALERARRHSPFLREALNALPAVKDTFCSEGATAALALARSEPDLPVGISLRRQRRALAFAVALGDLAGEFDLETATGALSDFADFAIDAAVRTAIHERLPDADPNGFAVLALGKLGSRELNYSSDVDLILLFDPDVLPRRARDEPGEAAVRVARRMAELLQRRDEHGYVLRVDLRLRPSSEVTPAALPVDAAISYYESSALPWERAAFIRARACAGDIALGERFLSEIRPFVWRRALDFGAIEEIRSITGRIRDRYEEGQKLGPGFDLKRGQGGIREVEFFAQVQQLIHGGRDPALRSPATIPALQSLAAAGHLSFDTAAAMGSAYRRLRTVEHRLQMVEDQQTHRLPLDAEALDNVAALDGLKGSEALLGSLRPHVERVAAEFGELLPERSERLSETGATLRMELARLGFADAEAAARRVQDWRSGRARSLRSGPARSAFEAMLPLLLGEIAGGPDPNHALNRLSDLVERLSSGVNFFRLLEARPNLARIFALVLAHAPVLSDQLARRPELLDGLIDQSSLDPLPALDDLVAALRRRIAAEPFDAALDRARRFVNERRFALGVQLVSGERDPLAVAEQYADLAEAAIIILSERTSAEFAERHGRVEQGELLILGLGRLGGRRLTHASDLDLIFLYDAPAGARSAGERQLSATDYYNRLAPRIVAALSVGTAAGPLYDVDTRLRPQGSKGMLAVSLDGFLDYQAREAWTWEHMALCRARPVFGSVVGRERLEAAIQTLLTTPHDAAKVRSDAGRMRSEMARHKPPAGPLDIKLGPGGLVDLEFAVHTLQLTTGQALYPRVGAVLAALTAAGLLDETAEADGKLLTRLLVVLRLVAPEGEPAPQSRLLVATLCGHESWNGLLEALGAARQRVAERWARVKEG
ncbi:bifunctional [glutamine synthetase] adenylyltransferase/[glutamine synthetase]-adenylyl-L-tyrosine phosphorylase [Sphingomonas ginkgonis]|uniref:Bifunctional [glutamine synthetase] adenylyltransferase/[glutamine synthetase]-adenylyl-L-tyrosine phosphorylase n=1 Tax=Sphingomonas ginkgonis TaxID=2315330 RepID=A0A3S0ENU1_9SPHN|nr:bifunctional [glutamine synthetase] adenylyltransferase/[glutamine synthetase]-adenylyl-L-tyrosine phosphorylase [Sphingomonas ginkgonis]RST31800.1 bifunctional [glutamine synthetase] adenylyltransferase/[glutamine synthetase]-adenylyl-L-tyrosine phosphorylase [Sphingomonas ginkgonis]